MSLPDKTDSIPEILDRLADGLQALEKATGELGPSPTVRNRLKARLNTLISYGQTLLGELDPIRQPRVVFDPGDPAVVGRFTALAMIGQRREPLAAIERCYGSGIYALYYGGDFGAYRPISGTETPIYVGKADPNTDTAKTPVAQGDRLYRRLQEHLKNIAKATDTLDLDDFDCRFLVVQSGWQGAAEDYLIDMFRPVWNNETGICYGFGKHGDSPSTRANMRSPWDTLHPGREWAGRDPNMPDARSRDRILADLEAHFSDSTIYRDTAKILTSFIDSLRQ